MDQNDGNKWDMPWYDWLVFLVPTLLIVGLGLESALGPKDVEYRDFRAVAHWFDPVFFQYNLIMALLAGQFLSFSFCTPRVLLTFRAWRNWIK